jgi:hypothetical protein
VKRVLLAVVALVATTAAAPAAAPVLTVGQPEVVHDSHENLCGTTELNTDGPVRAFTDDDGLVHLTVTNTSAVSYQWTGTAAAFTGGTPVLRCTPVLHSQTGNSNDPRDFNQRTWIQALYHDGSRVYAYGHEDFIGYRDGTRPDCVRPGTSGAEHICWYSAVTVWSAATGATHLSFQKVANHVAIYPRIAYPGDTATPAAGWIGYGTPSNIVRGPDGAHYLFVYSSTGDTGQQKGVCLFRSRNPANPATWRAWTGSGYTQRMVNPYSGTNTQCTVVGPFAASLRAVVRHAESGRYIAVYRTGSAVVYATSTDLITWSTPETLLTATTDEANYVSVIDFSAGGNHDTVHSDGQAYLYYRVRVANGYTQVVRRPITVT